MKILQIHNRYLVRGGEDESREAEVRLLREKGHHVIEYVESNERVAELGNWRTAIRTLWSAESYHKVVSLILHEKPDVLVVHNFFPLISPSVYYAARRYGIPVVQYLRNYRLFCPAAIFFREGKVCELCLGRWLAFPGIWYGCYRNRRMASAVVALMSMLHRVLGSWNLPRVHYVALSEFARKKYVMGGISPAHLSVQSNFLYSDPGMGDGCGNFILFVGRLSPEKGVSTLLNAWRLLKNPIPLKIIGEGAEADVLRGQSLGWDGVTWLGRMSIEGTLAMMGKAAVLVVPSECYETFGRVVIESYAKGTPVIASRIGAVQELVEEERTGFLFDSGDANKLADQLNRFLVLSESERKMMRIAARRTYESHFTADRHYSLLMELLTSVVRGQNPVPASNVV